MKRILRNGRIKRAVQWSGIYKQKQQIPNYRLKIRSRKKLIYKYPPIRKKYIKIFPTFSSEFLIKKFESTKRLFSRTRNRKSTHFFFRNIKQEPIYQHIGSKLAFFSFAY